MKKYRVLARRAAALAAALVLCFALAMPCFAVDSSDPDFAAELTWSSSIRVGSTWPASAGLLQKSVSAPFYGSNSAFASYTHSYSVPSFDGNYSNGCISCFPSRFELSSADWLSGAIGLYCSFYSVFGSGSVPGSWFAYPDSSSYQMFYIDHLGAEHIGPVSISSFTPVSDGSSVSRGYSFKASIIADQSEPVSAVGFSSKYSAQFFSFTPVDAVTNPSVSLVFPSCTVVVTSNSGELAALESMADNIAAQNQIMSQYYGQIVQVCNQIYQRLGDIQAAQEECNALFSQVINLLNTTNGKLSAINQAMSAYFEVLINQLKQEGIDTRSAIADAEARLELYLKPMIDYFTELEEQTGESAASLPGHKTDINKFDNQGYGIDSDGQTGLSALAPVFGAVPWIFQIIGIFIGVGIINLLVKKGLS